MDAPTKTPDCNSDATGAFHAAHGSLSDESKIVIFRPETSFPVAKRAKPRCNCSQVGESYMTGPSPSVYVDEATRDLECRKCGARLEAFDYMWLLATEGESITRELTRMREEKQTLKAQIELLHEQLRELKADGRKLARARKDNDQALRQPPTAAVERKGNDEIQ